jgi:hypothetical protein
VDVTENQLFDAWEPHLAATIDRLTRQRVFIDYLSLRDRWSLGSHYTTLPKAAQDLFYHRSGNCPHLLCEDPPATRLGDNEVLKAILKLNTWKW